ncbi:MAG: hypothetical protein HY908_32605 [Myxococcales bacterium]|nr:hypothetical protein [Myxococcales bacterium]
MRTHPRTHDGRATLPRSAPRWLVPVATLGLAAGAAACADPLAEERLGEMSAPIYSCPGCDNTIDTNLWNMGFDAAVGEIKALVPPGTPPSTCSAVAMSRTAVLTARHCTCTPVPDTFTLPQGFATQVTAIHHHEPEFDICEVCTGGGIDTALADVAVLILADPIPTSVMLDVPTVFTGLDVFAFADLHFPGGVEYYQTGRGATVWWEDTGQGVRRTGPVDPALHYRSGNCLSGDALETGGDDETHGSTHGHGDSGGGLFLVPLVDGHPNRSHA